MIRLRLGFALLALTVPRAAEAGQPFLTDDPVPTEPGHWQIFAPQFSAAGSGRQFDGVLETEIDYGAAPGVQLTLDVGSAYTHGAGGWRWGVGDVRASLKYRFYDDGAGFQVAAFPGLTLPTGTHGMSAGRVTAFLPIWAEKDWGPWSVFGGGGYALNPGSGNRDYWTAALAVTRQVNGGLLVGAEVQRQGADAIGGHGSTGAGAGAIVHLSGPLSFHVSGGPTWSDGGGRGFHAFTALALDF